MQRTRLPRVSTPVFRAAGRDVEAPEQVAVPTAEPSAPGDAAEALQDAYSDIKAADHASILASKASSHDGRTGATCAHPSSPTALLAGCQALESSGSCSTGTHGLVAVALCVLCSKFTEPKLQLLCYAAGSVSYHESVLVPTHAARARTSIPAVSHIHAQISGLASPRALRPRAPGSALEALLRSADCSADRFAAAFRRACEAALVAAYGRDAARAQAASRLLDDGNRRLVAAGRGGAASTSAQRSAPSAARPAAPPPAAPAPAAQAGAEHSFWIGSAPRVSEMLALQARCAAPTHDLHQQRFTADSCPPGNSKVVKSPMGKARRYL